MVSGKGEKPPRASLKNPKTFNNNKKKRKPLGPTKSISKSKLQNAQTKETDEIKTNKIDSQQPLSASQQLSFFLNQFQSANGVQLSSLELESIKDSSILELSHSSYKDDGAFKKDIKAAFGSSWKEALCDGQLLEGKIDPGSPSVLFISTSAIRAIELLRTVRSLTKECYAAKLFSKHMKVEEQVMRNIRLISEALALLNRYFCTVVDSGLWEVMRKLGHIVRIRGTSCAEHSILHVSLLKGRVNIAGGTPNRLKKLIEIEALGLSRLSVIVLDMRTDVKGYSLLTLPQVRDEFWDLYKNFFHQRLLEGDLRICLYGPIQIGTEFKGKRKVAEK